ncbi:hypothetical protein BV898_17266 [Hypsibius exemplaris]|uniref:HYR domain-containing protein n=1 Tax=Hypsibius exemplaris TaxID=2072580 RepID=A0A9X6NHD7_HYPEX|nr:hypothetical protein BV898_17266 [Hypsibius exemplaris]
MKSLLFCASSFVLFEIICIVVSGEESRSYNYYDKSYFPHTSPIKVVPASYGLVQLPAVYATRAPPNPAATEWPYAGNMNFYSNTTASPKACKSTTRRTILNCPCKLIGTPCLPANSICISAAAGDGICGCASGFLLFNSTCVTINFYNQNVTQNFTLLAPVVTASCFLPLNAVIGNVPQVGANGSVVYNLTLVSTSPTTTVTTKYISIESSTGNLLVIAAPPVATVANQTYTVVGTDATGIKSNIITFTVSYSCSAPVLSFDVGSSFVIDCTRFSVGDVVVTALATGTVAPTTFSMTLINSTSTLSNTFFAIDPTNGQVFLQNDPHGGIFVEVYNVVATNAVGVASTPLPLTFTTSATCT